LVREPFGLPAGLRVIDLEGLDPLGEISGVSAYMDHVTNAQSAGLEPHNRD